MAPRQPELSSAVEIRRDDLTSTVVQDLLHFHQTTMQANSPPGTSHALDLSGLLANGVTVWTAWAAGELAGIGALKLLDRDQAEVKSMRVVDRYLRRGVAAALLDHIISAARQAGVSRVSLETGSGPAFEPALALYRRRGFANGGSFADYPESDFNQFLHLELSEEPAQKSPPGINRTG